MRIRNHFLSFLATELAFAIFGSIGGMTLFEFALISTGIASALSLNLLTWEE